MVCEAIPDSSISLTLRFIVLFRFLFTVAYGFFSSNYSYNKMLLLLLIEWHFSSIDFSAPGCCWLTEVLWYRQQSARMMAFLEINHLEWIETESLYRILAGKWTHHVTVVTRPLAKSRNGARECEREGERLVSILYFNCIRMQIKDNINYQNRQINKLTQSNADEMASERESSEWFVVWMK